MSDIGKWYEQWSHSSGSIIDKSCKGVSYYGII